MRFILVFGFTFFFTEASNTEASFLSDFYLGGNLPEVEVVCKLPDPDHLDLLARLVSCEAGNQPFRGKLAVANVVVNRMEVRNRSLKQVVYRKGQFDGIKTKRFYSEPDSSCVRAAFLILTGDKVLPKEVLYFHNPKLSTDVKWVRKLKAHLHELIGDHGFYYDPRLLIP